MHPEGGALYIKPTVNIVIKMYYLESHNIKCLTQDVTINVADFFFLFFVGWKLRKTCSSRKGVIKVYMAYKRGLHFRYIVKQIYMYPVYCKFCFLIVLDL